MSLSAKPIAINKWGAARTRTACTRLKWEEPRRRPTWEEVMWPEKARGKASFSGSPRLALRAHWNHSETHFKRFRHKKKAKPASNKQTWKTQFPQFSTTVISDYGVIQSSQQMMQVGEERRSGSKTKWDVGAKLRSGDFVFWTFLKSHQWSKNTHLRTCRPPRTTINERSDDNKHLRVSEDY